MIELIVKKHIIAEYQKRMSKFLCNGFILRNDSIFSLEWIILMLLQILATYTDLSKITLYLRLKKIESYVSVC